MRHTSPTVRHDQFQAPGVWNDMSKDIIGFAQVQGTDAMNVADYTGAVSSSKAQMAMGDNFSPST